MNQEDVLYFEFEITGWSFFKIQIPNIFLGIETKTIIQILYPKGIENRSFSCIPRKSKKHLKTLLKAKSNMRHFYYLRKEYDHVYKILIQNGLEEQSVKYSYFSNYSGDYSNIYNHFYHISQYDFLFTCFYYFI